MTDCLQGSQASSGDLLWGSSIAGILGTVPSNPKVIAVFPALSATIIPFAQEIRFRRGDSFDIDVQVQNDQDPPSRVDISRGVLRFAAKLGYGTTPTGTIRNEGAQIIKRSYLASQIEFINETRGTARIKIKKSDTVEHPLNQLVWDLELTVPVEHLAGQPGTLILQSNMDVIQGVGTDFEAADVSLGDILHVQGKHVMILQRLSSTALKVDFSGWTTESGAEYNLYRGASKTIAGGPWMCLGDVVI